MSEDTAEQPEREAKPSEMANVKVGTMIRNQQARVEGGRRLLKRGLLLK